jgi:hypothetical protein
MPPRSYRVQDSRGNQNSKNYTYYFNIGGNTGDVPREQCEVTYNNAGFVSVCLPCSTHVPVEWLLARLHLRQLFHACRPKVPPARG